MMHSLAVFVGIGWGRWGKITSFRDQVWGTVTFSCEVMEELSSVGVLGRCANLDELADYCRCWNSKSRDAEVCIGWNQLPARYIAVHERSLRETFANRKVFEFLFPCFTVWVTAKKLRYGLLKSRRDFRCTLYIQLPLVGRFRHERSCFKPELYK
jgi:hypothetical protein